jgi:hypothetical protein
MVYTGDMIKREKGRNMKTKEEKLRNLAAFVNIYL